MYIHTGSNSVTVGGMRYCGMMKAKVQTESWCNLWIWTEECVLFSGIKYLKSTLHSTWIT